VPPGALLPLSRWVTPSMGHARRFDARFYVAQLPPGAAILQDPREVAAYRWQTPREALEDWVAARIDVWPPTSTTLAQLREVRGLDEVRERLSPVRPALKPEVQPIADALVRVRCHGAGGIPGQTVDTWVVGRRRLVVVDPGDPNDAAAEAILGVAAAAGGTIQAIAALTSPVPDHAAGAVGLSIRAGGAPICAARWAGSAFHETVVALADGAVLPAGDVALRAFATPGTHPGQLAYLADELRVALVGDLEGPGPSRSILPNPDERALAASRARIEALTGTRRFAAHAWPVAWPDGG
jgi:glyoxylase-like metal-dependent hydrolase (beta-lactamase superfamily II)